MRLLTKTGITSASLLSIISSANGVMITVDYRYDTNNFFDTAEKQAAMQQAADRWSSILADGQLDTAEINDTNDRRINFIHPGTGNLNYQISGASSASNDSLNAAGAGPADEYRSIVFPADTWILYAGGRDLGGIAGVGGTGVGINFNDAYTDSDSHNNRGFNTGSNSLAVWGGVVSFDSATTIWDFTEDASGTGTDFYSIALHEIGHALGLSSTWDDFQANVINGDDYIGANALAALNEDNGTSVTSIDLESSSDPHWVDGIYQSQIFEHGDPNYSGTVGEGNLQDLLVEPIANFTGSVDRFELTNVDVGAAQDIGWVVVVPEPSSISLLGLGSLALILRRKK